jgi:hypothetical protein
MLETHAAQLCWLTGCGFTRRFRLWLRALRHCWVCSCGSCHSSRHRPGWLLQRAASNRCWMPPQCCFPGPLGQHHLAFQCAGSVPCLWVACAIVLSCLTRRPTAPTYKLVQSAVMHCYGRMLLWPVQCGLTQNRVRTLACLLEHACLWCWSLPGNLQRLPALGVPAPVWGVGVVTAYSLPACRCLLLTSGVLGPRGYCNYSTASAPCLTASLGAKPGSWGCIDRGWGASQVCVCVCWKSYQTRFTCVTAPACVCASPSLPFHFPARCPPTCHQI